MLLTIYFYDNLLINKIYNIKRVLTLIYNLVNKF